MRVAFVDDDEQFLDAVTDNPRYKRVFDACASNSLDELIQRVQNEKLDAVVCDLRLGPENGVDALEQALELSPDIRLFLLTGFEPSHAERRRLDRIGADIYEKAHIDDLIDRLKEPAPWLVPEPIKVDEVREKYEQLSREHKSILETQQAAEREGETVPLEVQTLRDNVSPRSFGTLGAAGESYSGREIYFAFLLVSMGLGGIAVLVGTPVRFFCAFLIAGFCTLFSVSSVCAAVRKRNSIVTAIYLIASFLFAYEGIVGLQMLLGGR